MKIFNIKSNFDLNEINSSNQFSFMNLASLSSFFKNEHYGTIKYYCDGFLLCLLIFCMTGRRVRRVSFDFTSIAHIVFDHAQENGLKVAFVGATDEELNKFVSKIRARYPKLDVVYQRNGFFDDEQEKMVIQEIVSSQSQIVIAGLGAGKQERFLSKCSAGGFLGTGFSCGGFIRQESNQDQNYYPKLVNKLNLRAFYRMYKEPHTIKRYLLDYPKNLLIFTMMIVTKKIQIVFR